MSVFSRVSAIISSNLSALLDRAENPELLLSQVMHEMEEALGDAKRSGAKVIATERRLARELEWNRGQVELWYNRARQSLATGREALAREALAHKLEHDNFVCDLARQHVRARETNDRVRQALNALERRLTEARGKQRALAARSRAAKVRAQVSEQRDSGFFRLANCQGALGRIENRLEQTEEELIAYAELNEGADATDTEFSDLERERAIDAEIEALKQELPSK